MVAARPSLQGRLVEVLTDAGPGLGTVHATLVDRAPGPARELADLQPPQIEQWGAGLARLHAAGVSLVGWSTPDWLRSVVESVTDHQMSTRWGAGP